MVVNNHYFSKKIAINTNATQQRYELLLVKHAFFDTNFTLPHIFSKILNPNRLLIKNFTPPSTLHKFTNMRKKPPSTKAEPEIFWKNECVNECRHPAHVGS